MTFREIAINAVATTSLTGIALLRIYKVIYRKISMAIKTAKKAPNVANNSSIDK